MGQGGRTGQEQVETAGKKGCLWLALAIILFMAVVLGSMRYLISQPATERSEANERSGIDACWQSAGDEREPALTRLQIKENCAAMEERFRKKYRAESK